MSKYSTHVGLATILLMTLLLCECKPSERQSGSGEKPRIALVMKSLANEFFSTMSEGAKEHQLGNSSEYELIVNGIRNETDLAKQVSLVEQMESAHQPHETRRSLQIRNRARER